MSDVGKSLWDAREEYCKKLEELDNDINSIKARIEMKENLLFNLKAYFSGLRIMYRRLRPFMIPKKEKEKKIRNEALEWDAVIKEWSASIDDIEKKNSKTMRGRIVFNWDIVDKLEGFQNRLMEVRFENNLVVPRKSEDDEGFT